MIEFLLSIFFFLTLCYFIAKNSFFNDSNISRYWFIALFGIKVIVSIFLTLIYTKYYPDRSMADIYKYFDDSKIMFEAIKTNPVDYFQMVFGVDFNNTYFQEMYYSKMLHWTRPYTTDLFSDTHIIIRFNAFVRLFSFGNFQVHNVFINFISLVGITYLYKAFKGFLVNKEKLLFYFLAFVPSVLFWGSGLLKESIILFAIGLLLNHLIKLQSDFKISRILFILIATVLLIYSKFYLLIALSIPIGGYLINIIVKTKGNYLGYVFSFLFFFLMFWIGPHLNEQLDLIFQIANKQQTFSRFIIEVPANSGFLIPELTDATSIIINIPNALLNTMIRPYIWECNSLFVLLSALENLMVIIILGIAIFYRNRLSTSQKNILYFNLIFVTNLFILIGLTTPVFGAIVRYKIPGVILLLISLLLLLDLEKLKTKYSFLNNIL